MQRALIIDSDASAVATLAEQLLQKAWEVRTCNSVQDALTIGPSFHARLYVIEAALNDGLGCQVSRAVRRHPALYQATVLFTSPNDDVRDVKHFLREGGDEFLHKPFTAGELESKLAHLDRLHQATERKCSGTGFHSLQALHRDIEHRIFRDEDFALCYLFPRGLTRLNETRGNDAISEIARHTADVIRATLHNDGFYEFMCSHLGRSHFMVRLNVGEYKRFYTCVSQRFESAHRLVEPLGRGLDKLRFGVVYNNDKRRYSQVHRVFADIQDLGLSDESRRIRTARVGKGHEHWVD